MFDAVYGFFFLHLQLLQGETRFGSRGNNDVLRILFKPKNNIVTRSRPIPPPACGGAP